MRINEVILEGANMTAAYKDEKTGYWTYPDAYAKDPEVEAPYLSNASVREILSTLGLNPDFEEDFGRIPASQKTTQKAVALRRQLEGYALRLEDFLLPKLLRDSPVD